MKAAAAALGAPFDGQEKTGTSQQLLRWLFTASPNRQQSSDTEICHSFNVHHSTDFVSDQDGRTTPTHLSCTTSPALGQHLSNR